MSKPSRNNIYLTGFMGCGKSTVGKALAQRMGRQFLDTDAMVSESTGMPISALFRTRGEALFRTWESMALEQVIRQRDSVVALGGGALLTPGHDAWVARSGVLVYLRASPETLLERIRAAERPLLADYPASELPARLARLLAEREPGYRLAAIQVDTDNRGVGCVVDQVLREVCQCDA
jgi:shikimate kinase